MRTCFPWLLVFFLVPSLAAAGPITAGLNLGLVQSELDEDAGFGADHTLGLFGRFDFSEHVAGQLELSSVDRTNSEATIRTGTALLVVDLGSSARLVPVLFAGVGLDRAETAWGAIESAHHIEGGLGLEYRASNGVSIGADARLGGRSLHEPDYVVQPLADGARVIPIYAAPTLREGEFRAARVTLGVRF